jgi:hypothetical protein
MVILLEITGTRPAGVAMLMVSPPNPPPVRRQRAAERLCTLTPYREAHAKITVDPGAQPASSIMAVGLLVDLHRWPEVHDRAHRQHRGGRAKQCLTRPAGHYGEWSSQSALSLDSGRNHGV